MPPPPSSSFDDFDFGPTLKGLRPGTIVFNGRYTLERELGRGGMGVVWLAADAQLDRKVALKFLPDEVAKDDLALADLKRETKRCLELTHANIVRVFDWHEEHGLAAISMEYIDGASLSKLRLERENWVFSVDEVKPWLKAACNALEYAHTVAKVVHRDLKPANLMVTSSGMLKVCDFGIARSLGESRSRLTGGRTSDSAGTPPYMSPQHRMGMPPRPSDDVYGLGATLYELFTGKPPFYTGNIDAQIESVVPPSVAGRREDLGVMNTTPIPPEWEDLVAACLEKDPAKRPQSAGAVWTSLTAGAGEKPPIKKQKNKPVEKSQNGPGKAAVRPFRISVLLVLALLLGAGYLASWLYMEKKKADLRKDLLAIDAANSLRSAEQDAKWKEDRKAAAETGKVAATDGIKANPAEPEAPESGLENLARIEASQLGITDEEKLEKFVADYVRQNTVAPISFEDASPETIKSAAEAGNPEAQYQWAVYMEGNLWDGGVEDLVGKYLDGDKNAVKFQTEITSWYAKAAEQGHLRAQFVLSENYLSGMGVKEDRAKGFALLESAAKGGLVDAQFKLGLDYEMGDAPEKDFKKAFAWYEKARSNGHPEASKRVGFLYKDGNGVGQSYVKAAGAFQEAVDRGEIGACVPLGKLYESGQGVAKDLIRAVALYRDAELFGEYFATPEMSRIRYDKIIAEKILKVAETGDPLAQGMAACLMAKNGVLGERNMEKAAEWARKAADNDDAYAQYLFGLMHAQGEGVPQKISDAAEWIRKSADQGYPFALLLYGAMNEHGEGVTTNHEKALEYYGSAADKGVPKARELADALKAKIRDAKRQPQATAPADVRPGDVVTDAMIQQAAPKAKKVQAMVLATGLASAVQQFYMEYSRNPTLDDASAGNVLSNDSAFIAQLAGQTKENHRGIDFIGGISEAKGSPPANGLLRQNGKVQVLDPWGMPFHIAIDHDYDGETATPDGSDGGKLQNKVLVLSCGPDKTLKGKNPDGGDATQDNIKSW